MPDFSKMWGGPAFALSIELGPLDQKDLAISALKALWKAPGVHGPWSKRTEVGLSPPDRKAPLDGLGQLELDGDFSAGFSAHLIAERNAYDGSPSAELVRFHGSFGEGADWLTIDVPVPMIGASPNDSWALSVTSHVQVALLCEAFARIADAIFAAAPFRCGVVGEEVSGCWRSPTPNRVALAVADYSPQAVLTAEVIENRGGFFLAPGLWNEIAPRVAPMRLGSGLLL